MEQQLKALDESVRIWEYKVSLSLVGLAPYGTHCPLCNLNRGMGNCGNCIIRRDTGRVGCEGTPYYTTSMVGFGIRPGGDVKMLEYLKKLRRKLTMGNEELKVGDVVGVTDSSYAVSLNGAVVSDVFVGYEGGLFHLRKGRTYTIVEFAPNRHIRTPDNNKSIHDVVIKGVLSGNLYLHSKCMLTLIKPKIKEVTMADLEAKYGCKVKVVKS